MLTNAECKQAAKAMISGDYDTARKILAKVKNSPSFTVAQFRMLAGAHREAQNRYGNIPGVL